MTKLNLLPTYYSANADTNSLVEIGRVVGRYKHLNKRRIFYLKLQKKIICSWIICCMNCIYVLYLLYLLWKIILGDLIRIHNFMFTQKWKTFEVRTLIYIKYILKFIYTEKYTCIINIYV